MRAASRRIRALVLWLVAGASLSACSAEQPEPPPFGEGDAGDDASGGLTSADAAGPTTTVSSATSGGPTSGTTGGTSGGTPGGTSGGTTGSATTGTTTANPLGGTQTGAVTTGGMGMGNTTSGGVTTGAVTSGGPTTGGGSTTTGGGFTTGGATTGAPIGGGVSTTTGGGFTNGGAGANTTGGEPCTNVDPTGTDWDEATCDQWASETDECEADWMVDNNYCNESCGRCTSTAPFGGG